MHIAPRVVAITDRRLMVPADLLATGDWPAIAAAFGDAIARAVATCPPDSVVVQVREKDLDGGPLLHLVRAALPFAPTFVNDRIDVALAANAFGVHLPERGLPLDDARRLAPTLAIGVSRHAVPLDASPTDTTAAATTTAGSATTTGGPPDLVHLGPIWPTPSKPSATPLTEAALANRHGPFLLVAVGGIDSPDRARLAAASGADAVAVIRAAWSGASLAPIVAAVEAGVPHRRSLGQSTPRRL